MIDEPKKTEPKLEDVQLALISFWMAKGMSFDTAAEASKPIMEMVQSAVR